MERAPSYAFGENGGAPVKTGEPCQTVLLEEVSQSP